MLLDLKGVTLLTPNGATTLVQDLDLKITQGDSLLLMGPSGTGKTSLLRAIAGLWDRGAGRIVRGRGEAAQEPAATQAAGQAAGQTVTQSATQPASARDVMFVPQRPYMVLGNLRDQLLYPTWADLGGGDGGHSHAGGDVPDDAALEAAMERVRLGEVMRRVRGMAPGGNPLDVVADWASKLSLGEQQRLAFARCGCQRWGCQWWGCQRWGCQWLGCQRWGCQRLGCQRLGSKPSLPTK